MGFRRWPYPEVIHLQDPESQQSQAPTLLRVNTTIPPLMQPRREKKSLSGNGDLNLNTSLDVDDDLLDGLGGGKQAISSQQPRPRNPTSRKEKGKENILYQTLVDAHLVLVPGLGTLTVGGLTGGDVQGLGGQTDGTLDLQGLGASTVDKLRADLLEGGDLARGKSDTDLVDLLYVQK